MKILTYNDMTLKVLAKSEHSSCTMKLACDVTQKRLDDSEVFESPPLSSKLAQFLIKAEHTSVFEHGSISILASGISRSLLAQVTRQRHFSFTSASQHYQNYSEYPMSLRPGWDGVQPKNLQDALTPEAQKDQKKRWLYSRSLQVALDSYIELIELGEPPEEARQLLPNACTVNLVITANPRALCDFLRARLCFRNTKEMRVFAQKLHRICINWLPEIFEHIAEPCAMDENCNQGKMSCLRQ